MANQSNSNGYVLGLDVGDARIGVAIASTIAKLPQPLPVIVANDEAYNAIKELIIKESVDLVVIGIPRNLNGEETAQSASIREFAAGLNEVIGIPIAFADESLSSARADELTSQNDFKNVSQDSLAACFILEEFFATIEKGDS